jgi:hypothetical protein
VSAGGASGRNGSDQRAPDGRDFRRFRLSAPYWPPLAPLCRPTAAPHLSCGQPVRPTGPLDECRNRRNNTSRWQGDRRSFGRTLSGTIPKKIGTIWSFTPIAAQFLERRRLSSDTSWHYALFSGPFLNQCPVVAAIFATIAFLRKHIWRKVQATAGVLTRFGSRLNKIEWPARLGPLVAWFAAG